MTKNENFISREEFQNLLRELNSLVEDSVFEADQKANDHRAPESYRSDMKGYARGLSIMGHKIIMRLKELL